MKIGIIADTHIPQRAKNVPEKVIRIFSGVDMILHAGDLTDLAVLDELKQITPEVTAVLGNMDPSQNQLILPLKRIVEVADKKIALIHGAGGPGGLRMRIWNEVKMDRPDIVVFGHSHQPEKALYDNVLFLNPGSPTDKVFASLNSVALLTIQDDKPEAEIIIL